jgi:heavy metal efflux system protein
MKDHMKIKLIVLIMLSVFTFEVFAQNPVTLEEAVQAALKNNISLRAAGFEVESKRNLKGTAFDLPKTTVTLMSGQYNSYAKNDNNITVTQTIPFAVLGSQGNYNRATLTSSELQLEVSRNELIYQVRQVYIELSYAKARQALLQRQDSIYQGFLTAAKARYKSGETHLLEQATAGTQASEVKNQLRQNTTTINSLRIQLKTLLNSELLPDASDELRELPSQIADSMVMERSPSLKFMNQQVEVAASRKRLEAAKFAPDIVVGAFSQTLIGVENTDKGTIASSGDRFTGFQVGLAIPLWFGPHRARVRAAESDMRAAESNYTYYRQTLNGQQQQALEQYRATRSSLDYYQSSALVNAQLILTQSQAAFRGGEINYAEYLMGLRNALSVQENYLSTLRDYNQSIIYIDYLSGNP